MSIQGVIEFALHLESFRNVDLFRQGLYGLRFTLYYTFDDEKNFAFPYSTSSSIYPSSNPDPYFIEEMRTQDVSVESRKFLLRFCEEVVDFNETIYFRAEMEIKEDFKQQNFKLHTELLFGDLKGKLTPEEATQAVIDGLEIVTLSEVDYVLSFPKGFKSSYFPAIFDDDHSSILKATLHYTLLDYHFRGNGQSEIKKSNDISQSLSEYLFKSKNGASKTYAGMAETDMIYNNFMNPLVKSYEKLREHYMLIAGKFFNDKERDKYGIIAVPETLNMPGNDLQALSPNSKERKETLHRSALSTEDNEAEDEIGEEKINEESPFSSRVASHDPKVIATAMLMELNTVSGQLFQLWHQFLDILEKSKTVSSILSEKRQILYRQKLSNFLIRRVMRSKDLGMVADESKNEQMLRSVNQKRYEITNSRQKLPHIYDEFTFADFQNYPILVEELSLLDASIPNGTLELAGIDSSMLSKNRKNSGLSSHIIVFVHGYQGRSNDLRILKNRISLAFPNTFLFSSVSNEENTDLSIEELGQKLADEVTVYIEEFLTYKPIGKISFIGHSLGGLIIRAALPLLSNYTSYMHLFMTLSCPHLGVIEGSNSVLKAGMWILKKVKKCPSFKELTFTDKENVKDGLIYKLSEGVGLDWFSHVILISSPQDHYIPHYSARIEAPTSLEHSKILRKMAKRLLGKRERIHRIDVHYKVDVKTFDQWIGRAAHIECLENNKFMDSLIYLHPELFC
ncbi:unnamed protein product [Blepharisma stoltei]|uniref:DUF676 domain-containing protein n=1 Tax=Blepharisma stoltei TaxID=1481888 RepID=A0AAU9IBS9_9CILI|nr:unnamed protein product [Blepharisma stoltei]